MLGLLARIWVVRVLIIGPEDPGKKFAKVFFKTPLCSRMKQRIAWYL